MTGESREFRAGRMPCGHFLILLKPFESGKAKRSCWVVTQHQAVPEAGLVEPADLSLRSAMRWQSCGCGSRAKRLDRQGFGIDRASLL